MKVTNNKQEISPRDDEAITMPRSRITMNLAEIQQLQQFFFNLSGMSIEFVIYAPNEEKKIR